MPFIIGWSSWSHQSEQSVMPPWREFQLSNLVGFLPTSYPATLLQISSSVALPWSVSLRPSVASCNSCATLVSKSPLKGLSEMFARSFISACSARAWPSTVCSRSVTWWQEPPTTSGRSITFLAQESIWFLVRWTSCLSPLLLVLQFTLLF